MKKILVIEGNGKTRENTGKILSLANYTVITADTGMRGIEFAQNNLPDMIICNSELPDMDGYCISSILSKDKRTKGIPIIILSGKESDGDSSNKAKVGLDDYLVKSFESVDFFSSIETQIKNEKLNENRYVSTISCLKRLVDKTEYNCHPEKCSYGSRTRTFEKRENIYREGDPLNVVYLVKKGRVKTVKTGPEGKEFVIEMYEKGDFLGHVAVFEGLEYPDTAIAIEETEVCMIPKEDFSNQIRTNGELSWQFIKMLAKDISEKEERLMTLAYNSVRARAAGVMLQLQKKYQKDFKSAEFTLHISRDDLAGIIGTTAESVTRTLTDLKNENIIETDKGEITILDSSKLERIRKFS